MPFLSSSRLALICLPLLLASCGGGGGGGGGAGTTTPTSPVVPSSTPNGSVGAIATLATDHVVTLDYNGYKLLYDCTRHTALRYEYQFGSDTGSAARPSNFTLDPALPAGCEQQSSTGTYASVHAGYDRGHLVTSNHMDATDALIARANYMTNIVPQVAAFNQGIWADAENVAECWRDLAPVQVYGGVAYTDTSNDYYLTSHGIATPDWFWKAVVTTDLASGAPKVIAWWIPNQTGLASLDSYLVSIDELEQLLGSTMVGIDLPTSVKSSKPATTWPQPAGCSLSQGGPAVSSAPRVSHSPAAQPDRHRGTGHR